MKVIILVLSLLLISTAALAEETTRELITDSYELPLAYVYFNKDGKEIARQKFDAMMFPESSEQIPAGVPDGIIKEYYDNGQLRQEIPYGGGKVNGVIKGYYEDGKLNFEQSTKDGKADGFSKEYRKDGTLVLEEYRKNNIPYGVRKVYYRDGKLKAEENNVNGIRQWGKEYDENGQLIMEQIFEDGKYVLRYYKNGNIQKEDTYDRPPMITRVPEY
jgi:antitoxin component YwqK of YwqJK toxin-antitoxin module